LVFIAGYLAFGAAGADGLTAARLGVIYNTADPGSHRLALYYAAQRGVPLANVVGVPLPAIDVLAPELFEPLRKRVLAELPTMVQALLLVWSKPYAVGCMSVTTAFAAGYRSEFCQPGCSRTILSPLFDSIGWLPVDTVGWYPAMLLPSADEGLAHQLTQRGMSADFSAPPGIVYLVRTSDPKRNVRAENYADIALAMGNRLQVVQMSTPMPLNIPDAIGYFTGIQRVVELPRIQFRPGALADHLTSVGGVLDGTDQMSIVEWLKQGATASYGTVSEPCSIVEKFPDVGVLFDHYRHGETALESYWKSVAMPGQGIFIGEPLARPYAVRGR
jgi:uncharacterized protein (TIGR03790 family)